MLRSLFLLLLAACSIPTEDDVTSAVDDCREIVRAEIPSLVAQVVVAAAAVCGEIGDEARDAILLYVGCEPPEEAGGLWDCDGARARACTPPVQP